jgi:uncharacterized surface protein with fasciclin (FAS1) repeats
MKKTVITLVAVFVFAFTAVFSPAASPVAAAGGTSTIAQIASSNGSFTTLVAALDAAGLVGTLNGKGQFTVFAPTDEAFAKLGLDASNIGSLPKADLTNILLYHVARGERLSGDVVSASRIRMMNGGFVFVSGTTLNSSSNIVAVDILASNGVIHVIDTVLLP